MPTMQQLSQCLPAGWDLRAEIDSGGQGAVYRGAVNGQDVAIKLFHSLDDDRRVSREVDLLRDVDSPCVVGVRDYAQITVGVVEVEVVAYDYLAGGTLASLLDPTCGDVGVDNVIQIGSDVGEALDEIWHYRVVHRDIKPGNLMIGANGRTVLVDFGLARHLDLSDVTQQGAAPGTRGYKSPEQARGRRSLTKSSDIYSLGVTLYHLLTKQHPFGGRQPNAMTPLPPPPSIVRNDVGDGLSKLIIDMMSPIPSSRPQNIKERFNQLSEG